MQRGEPNHVHRVHFAPTQKPLRLRKAPMHTHVDAPKELKGTSTRPTSSTNSGFVIPKPFLAVYWKPLVKDTAASKAACSIFLLLVEEVFPRLLLKSVLLQFKPVAYHDPDLSVTPSAIY